MEGIPLRREILDCRARPAPPVARRAPRLMNLILWRHADAEDAAPGASDDARGLTAKGEKQAKRMAAWLKSRLLDDAEILVSPARRAQQTAQALTRRFQTSAEVGT